LRWFFSGFHIYPFHFFAANTQSQLCMEVLAGFRPSFWVSSGILAVLQLEFVLKLLFIRSHVPENEDSHRISLGLRLIF